MRVLVTGGREYPSESRVTLILAQIHETREITALITGGDRGADYYAEQWAKRQPGMALVRFPFDRPRPRHNQKMLDQGKPGLVIAFAGNVDMVRRARKAGLDIVLPDKEEFCYIGNEILAAINKKEEP